MVIWQIPHVFHSIPMTSTRTQLDFYSGLVQPEWTFSVLQLLAFLEMHIQLKLQRLFGLAFTLG